MRDPSMEPYAFWPELKHSTAMQWDGTFTSAERIKYWLDRLVISMVISMDIKTNPDSGTTMEVLFPKEKLELAGRGFLASSPADQTWRFSGMIILKPSEWIVVTPQDRIHILGDEDFKARYEYAPHEQS